MLSFILSGIGEIIQDLEYSISECNALIQYIVIS